MIALVDSYGEIKTELQNESGAASCVRDVSPAATEVYSPSHWQPDDNFEQSLAGILDETLVRKEMTEEMLQKKVLEQMIEDAKATKYCKPELTKNAK